jgi:hypothetical protein
MTGWDRGEPRDGPTDEALARVHAGRNELYSVATNKARHAGDRDAILAEMESEIAESVRRAFERLDELR